MDTSSEYEKKDYNMLNKTDGRMKDIRNKDQSDMRTIIDEKNITKGNIKEPDSIEAVLDNAGKATVSRQQYADCIIMDFAGHREYYSTHQTFLTKNAIYLVVLSLKKENLLSETYSETGW